MRYRTGLLLALLVCATATAQQVYRWVDANGVVHYSDQPPPGDGAEAIDIEVPPGVRNPSRALAQGQSVDDRRSSRRDDREDVDGAAYRRATITQPQPEEVLWNIATELPVAMTLEPTLAGSHRVQWILDGRPMGEAAQSLQTTLTPVYRGEHTLSAQIIGPSGEAIYEVAPVTFYVQQTTVFRR